MNLKSLLILSTVAFFGHGFAQETIIPADGSYVVSTSSSESNEGKIEWVIGANYWLAGSTYWSSKDIEVDKEGTLFLSVVADYYVANRFVTGIYANIGTFKSEGSDSETMTEIGMVLRPKLILSESVALKVGPALGYRTISSDDSDYIGMALNMDVELQFGTNSDKFKKFLHVGFLAQPIGGSDDWDFDFPPIWFVGGGVAF